MFRISDLRNKDIINSLDGKRLGFIKDVELNLHDGKIQSIVLPAGRSFMSLFSKDNDIIINWSQIQKIGVDVIIVELPTFTPLNPYSQNMVNNGGNDEARWLLKGE